MTVNVDGKFMHAASKNKIGIGTFSFIYDDDACVPNKQIKSRYGKQQPSLYHGVVVCGPRARRTFRVSDVVKLPTNK